jgi:hypothetical protein
VNILAPKPFNLNVVNFLMSVPRKIYRWPSILMTLALSGVPCIRLKIVLPVHNAVLIDCNERK